MSKTEKVLRTKVNDLLEEVRGLNSEIQCLEEENKILLGLVKQLNKEPEPVVIPEGFWPGERR